MFALAPARDGSLLHMTSPLRAAPGTTPIVLVLPFASSAGDEATYLAEGVSDELVMALSQLPSIGVVGRGTAVSVRDTTAGAREAAAAIGASLAVSGTVALEAGTLQVRAEIHDADSQSPPAVETLQVPLADFARGVARLAERVLAACHQSPPHGWEARVTRPMSDNAEALDLVLRGRHHAEQRPIGVKLAMQCFDRAIRLDGEVAAAHGALAILWANFGIFLALTPQQASERAREQAQRALLADADEPWALSAMLTVATFYDWDLPRADALGRALLARYPSLVAPRQVLLYAHAARGDEAAVRDLGREVQRLDPRAVDPLNDLAFALLLCGAAREAVTLLEAHAEAHPAASEVHRRLGLALMEVGEGQHAVAHLERSVALSRRHAWGVANLACARARAGDADGARTLLAELVERADGELVPNVALAEIHASLGAHDAAFDALERALDARDYWLLTLDVDPLLAPLRGDDRFAALAARRRPRPAG